MGCDQAAWEQKFCIPLFLSTKKYSKIFLRGSVIFCTQRYVQNFKETPEEDLTIGRKTIGFPTLAGTERNDGISKKFPGPHTLNH
jgi:hypothetical protein